MVLMEQDNTPDDAINKGYEELIKALLAVLSGLAPLFLSMGLSPQFKSLIEHAVHGVIASYLEIGGFLGSISPGGNDNSIGFKTYIFTQNQLASALPAGIPISHRWTNNHSVPAGPDVEITNDDNGDWEITGTVTSSPNLIPRLSVAPSTLQLPPLPVGEFSPPKPVTLRNEGGADLHVSLVKSSTGNFRWPALVDTLKPSETRVFNVTFVPRAPAPPHGTQPQARTGTISVPSDGGSVVIHVSGSVRPGSPL